MTCSSLQVLLFLLLESIFDMLVLVITCSSLAEIHPTASASTHSTAARTELILDICLLSGGCNMILHNSGQYRVLECFGTLV